MYENIRTAEKDEVQRQSKVAFDKWRELWIGNCKRNRPKIMTRHADVGKLYRNKQVHLFAYGPSFKETVLNFKKGENDVIGCVDKAFKPMIELGLQPDFVLIADGSVSAEKWLYGVPDEAIRKCLLISNVYGQPDWSDHWAKVAGCKNIYWYLNKDNIECTPNNKYGTAEFFCGICGYYEMIEAGSNVGNSLLIFTIKVFGAKNVYLYAYDYCWETDGDYYGSVDTDKRVFLPHLRLPDMNNKLVLSTPNMDFSARWMDRYVNYCQIMFKVNIINRTGKGILRCPTRKVA